MSRRTYAKMISGHASPRKAISQCRREHESPLAEFEDQMQDAPQPPDIDPFAPDQPAPLPPAFVADLSTRLIRMGYDVADPDFDVLLRTWYIDHVTIRRWTAPRNLQLAGPPSSWESQFSSLWVDQINPNEWFDVTVIHPDPPRTLRNSFIAMDVVVTQSIELDRYAGLVTVLPDASSFELFSVAASFDQDVSGFDIASAADADRLCRYRECTVTFGWQDIPFTLRPHHQMSHGDGFQLLIRSTSACSVAQERFFAHASSSTDRPPFAFLPPINATAGPAVTNGTSDSVDQPSQFVTPLHIFQMEGMVSIVNLYNAQLAMPSHDIAEVTRVPLNCIEALHIMPIPPDGFPELAIPAIMQRQGDIDLHSTDRLIMIDVIYHPNPEAVTGAYRPTLVRGVHRVTHQVTRQQLLFKGAVLHYCEFMQEGCAVSLDGLLWPITQTDPRPVSHGSYATIDVPPLQHHPVDTRQAADVLHIDGTTDATMNLLLEPDDIEDAHSLAQVYAAKKLITQDVKRLVRSCCRNVPLPIEVGPDGKPLHSHPTSHAEHPPAAPDGTCKVDPTSGPSCDPKPSATHQDETLAVFPRTGHADDLRYIEYTPQDHATGFDSQAGSTMKNDITVKSPAIQSSLHRFFGQKPKAPHPRIKSPAGPGQRKISDFFLTKKAEAIRHDSAPTTQNYNSDHPPDTTDVSVPSVDFHKMEGTASNERPSDRSLSAPAQHKCSEQQESAPPVFETDQPRPQPHNPPPRPQRPVWRMHLGNLFDELATVRHPDAGPVMQVEVWYVHHETFPECHAPRVVELDNFQDLWYADICNVWMDRIQRHQPLRVLNVLPNPPFHTRARTAVHLILEQGLHPEKVAIHFTTLFLGGDRIGLFQRALSAPTHICTRDMIVRHGFQLQCDYRNCNMHSGRLRFSMYDPEEIFSGISAVLSVAPPPPNPWPHTRSQVCHPSQRLSASMPNLARPMSLMKTIDHQ